ncbi:MAG: hypothetical protein ACYC5Q_03475 [Thermoleophilia bacterium]
MIASRLRIVVTDANVLINLIHVERLDVLGALEGYEFVVPADVREEITDLDQRAALEEAIGRSFFRIEHVTELRRDSGEGSRRVSPWLMSMAGPWRPTKRAGSGGKPTSSSARSASLAPPTSSLWPSSAAA